MNYDNRSKPYERKDNTICFGLYPQGKVTCLALIETLNDMAGELPTATNNGSWISYGYYTCGKVENYAWYCDIEREGEKYRGVYFTALRPDDVNTKSAPENSRQYDNEYSENRVYWFKFEPIKWHILREEEGIALLLADLILDAQEFNATLGNSNESDISASSNNWEHSGIRKWLNDVFYNTAFTETEKTLICESKLDNKTTAKPNDDGRNRYATQQNNTKDSVFLLSYKEVKDLICKQNTLALRRKNSDYALSQGAGASTLPDTLSNGTWWLRSPFYLDSNYASFVSFDGNTDFNSKVIVNCNGILPALNLIIK